MYIGKKSEKWHMCCFITGGRYENLWGTDRNASFFKGKVPVPFQTKQGKKGALPP